MDDLIYKEDAVSSAADAVEIIRCEYCQNKEESLDEEFDYWCFRHGSYVYKDDFCSYGED